MDPTTTASPIEVSCRLTETSGWKRRLMAQFGRPTGFWGGVAGWVMAHRPSNRARNLWTVNLLDIQPEDKVLEIGFGPGLAIGALVERVTTGKVCGVDHSQRMVQMASRRNAAALREGRLQGRRC